MSGKQAKKERKESEERARQVVAELHLQAFGDGQLSVVGPEDPLLAIDMLSSAVKIITNSIRDLRKANQSRIISLPPGANVNNLIKVGEGKAN